MKMLNISDCQSHLCETVAILVMNIMKSRTQTWVTLISNNLTEVEILLSHVRS